MDVSLEIHSIMKELARVLQEALIVLAMCLVVGFIANEANTEGLSLTRNYFPTLPANASPPPVGTQPESSGNGTDGNEYAEAEDPQQAIIQRIEAAGLQVIPLEDVIRHFESVEYLAQAAIFIDARNEKHYREGHIPNALHMDHYQIERTIDEVLPMCFSAMTVVVYCGGGSCEDSEFAANELVMRGVDPSKLHVFLGGIKEWKIAGMPVEVGERGSGDIITEGASYEQ